MDVKKFVREFIAYYECGYSNNTLAEFVARNLTEAAPITAGTERELLERIASRPLSTENMHSTWCPPEWEQIVEWWDEITSEARALTGKKYR